MEVLYGMRDAGCEMQDGLVDHKNIGGNWMTHA
jgi:hypothetical protein